MRTERYYKLRNEECAIIYGLLKHHEQELHNMKEILIRLRSLRPLTDDEIRSYNEATDEMVKINAIINKLL